jgi:serine/threonine-protein kinase
MPVEDAVPVVDQLAAAIDHAVDRGVAHGSLHPRDILLSAGSLRVTGFGIAAALSAIGATQPTRTQYAAPGSASDIYSLGAIAFELITGRRAFSGNLAELEVAEGPALRRAFEKALGGEGRVRAARAGEFAAALRAAAGHTPTVAPATVPRPSGAPAAPDAPAPDAPLAPEAPVAPEFAAPVTPAPLAPVAPRNSPDPLDRAIDLGPPRERDVTPVQVEDEPIERRWPLTAALVAVVLLLVAAAGYFLRPSGVSDNEGAGAVDETTVDLRGSGSRGDGAGSTAGKTELAAPVAKDAPPPSRDLPAPTPSRPASGAVRRPSKPTPGSLLIRSTPADADVMVNGRASGKTPLTLRDLELGSYTIRITRGGYSQEERTLQLSTARPSASTTFDLRPAVSTDGSAVGQLNVQSRPAGARVFVNDRLVGATPLAAPGIAAGPATVRIELEGYLPWVTTVRITAGEQIRVAASLERP